MTPRVLIGPANSAGQAHAWAQSLTKHGVRADSLSIRGRPLQLTSRRSPPGFSANHYLPYPRLTITAGRRRRARRLLPNYSHLVLDGFVPILDRAPGVLTLRELSALRELVPVVVLLAHGSDVRDPGLHISRIPNSYFAHMDAGLAKSLGNRAAANRLTAKRSRLPMLVSTPDLLIDLPTASWIPVVVDVPRWSAIGAKLSPQTRRPRFLFAPSSNVVKGSNVVDGALEELANRGLIEYVRLQGASHEVVLRAVGTVDVVVDQVRSGSYGVAAAEAMAAGRVVVGHVAEDVRRLISEPIPIVDAPASTFKEEVSNLLDTRTEWPRLGQRGSDFAAKWHGGLESFHRLRSALSLIDLTNPHDSSD